MLPVQPAGVDDPKTKTTVAGEQAERVVVMPMPKRHMRWEGTHYDRENCLTREWGSDVDRCGFG